YDGSQIPFDKPQALRYFGYGKGADVPADAEIVFDECAKEAQAACAYRVCYAEFPIKTEGNTLDLGFTKTTSAALAKNLQGCEKVIAFAATVGIGVDRLISRYEKVSPFKAYAFQAIGAERVESLCDTFNGEITKTYEAEGLYTRPRFSCGYGDFPLEKQRDFFAALDCQRKIGLTLNDSCLMSPSKSVTALIGIGKTPRKTSAEKCEACENREHCSFKK
ncbi:MAG: Vitamin B12 dependent methionine synthase activation subunit, partial [Clostridia bacterium]|nr:Vitamin B12 dependent methionine synthase activation subunit [Clostridia bacterium]